MPRLLKRLIALALAGAWLLWALAAAAGQYSLDPSQEVYLPGSSLPAYLAQGDASHQGSTPLPQAYGSQDGASQALAASTYWWYFTSGHYDLLMPGTATGPYANYYYFALSLSGYLGESYGAASRVLGAGNGGYGNIDLWLTSSSTSGAVGWYYPGSGSNSIYLNLWYGGTSAYFGSVAAHETTHLILDHQTNLYNRDSVGSNWFTEALAYYVGDGVYAYGSQHGYAYNSALLEQYSRDGAQRSSWYDSGARYLLGSSTDLDWVQLNVIGFFLANSDQGWSAIQGTVRNLSRGLDLESSLRAAYGLASGMYDTASGAQVNTLYSAYTAYYLGHY